MVQGANDPRVPRTEVGADGGARSSGTARRSGTSWPKDEGHGFRKKPNVDYLFYATVAFVRRFLLDQAS